MQNGILYVVSTPIGHLADITYRAVETLQKVDLIAAEDTRHSRPLLQHYGITTPVIAYHDHNEEGAGYQLLRRLEEGQQIAMISDAGTPLIRDPGFQLVRECHRRNLRVVPIPGPSALLCALAAAGVAPDRFSFEGFPPRTRNARQEFFRELRHASQTVILYEASHRIMATLADAITILGPEREAAIGRELTKRHETLLHGPLEQLQESLRQSPNQRKGEFVLLIAAAPAPPADAIPPDTEQMLTLLLAELPLKRACALAAQISGMSKNVLYRRALELNEEPDREVSI